MAITRESIIQNLYSTTVSAVPDSNLQLGEIAINSADEAVFIKNSGGTVKKLSATSDFTNNFITLSTTQTVSGDKTFSGTTTFDSGILFEGATANAHETTLTVVDPTADNTITLPDSTGTVALTNNKLSVFAATTSAELAGVISNETGSGDLVFGTSPTITTSMVAGGSSFDLINTTATGVNFAGAATTLSIGAVTGTATINNANTVVTGDLAVNGGDITTTSIGTATVFNTTATTMNLGGAATAITMGDATTATTTVRGGTLVGNTATQSLFNTTATTLNLGGAATAITMGDATAATTTVRGGTLVGNLTTQNLFNTTATTLNLGGAATTLSIGAVTGTATINNANTVVTGDLAVNGGDITTTAATATLMNATATTLSVGGAATTLTIGATSGTTAIRNAVKLGNTTAQITTNSGTTNSLLFSPYGDLRLEPITTAASSGGTNTKLTITNTNDGVGTVTVVGGDLVLGTKNTDEFTTSAVNLIFEGTTDNGFDTTLTVTDPTANRTITLPDATDTLVGKATTDTLTNKTLTTPKIAQINDTNGLAVLKTGTTASAVNEVTITNNITAQAPHVSATGTDTNISLHLAPKGTGKYVVVENGTDGTKQIAIGVAGAATATTTYFNAAQTANRTITLPDATDTLVGRDTTDTLTNKTLTSPVISTITNVGTLTLPSDTTRLVGRNTTDTLTNKTLTSPVISTITNTGTLTLPTSTDTLVGRATTDTLTNKTLTTPKIAQINDTNGLAVLKTGTTASAVNEVTITNNITAQAPHVSATGTDTNISLHLAPKGTGKYVVVENGTDGTKQIAIGVAGAATATTTFFNAAQTVDRTITLPDATGTVALIAGSDTHVLFNDGGVVGGDSGLTYNKTTDALTVTGDLAVNGGDITSSAVTFNLLNSTVTTMNLGGAATAITMGDATTATTTVRGGTLVGNATTQNLFNTTATTINLGGAATTINLGPTGGTGAIDVNRNTIQEATLKFYNETTSAPAISAGTLTLDLSAAQVFTVSLNANVTTLTISNTPATASRSIGFTLILTADGTARTVTWGAAVLWPAGTSPTLTSTNGKKDVFSFVTTDGGTTWLGFTGGQNF